MFSSKYSFYVQALIFFFFLILSATSFSMSLSIASSSKDVYCLSSTIYREARGEKLEGKLAVASVVLNRVNIQGKSVCSIVKQRGQFSWVKSLGFPSIKNSMQFSLLSYSLILANKYGVRKCYANNATHFATNSTNNYWTKKLKKVKVVGGHSFYQM